MLEKIISEIPFTITDVKLGMDKQSVIFKHGDSKARYGIKIVKGEDCDNEPLFTYILQENGCVLRRTSGLRGFLQFIQGLKPPVYPILNSLRQNWMLTRARVEPNYYHNVYKASVKGDVYNKNRYTVHIFESRHSTLWEVYVDYELLDAGSHSEGLLQTIKGDCFTVALRKRQELKNIKR